MSGKESLAALTQRNVDTIAKIEAAAQGKRTVGERISDAIAISIGSWTFILTQVAQTAEAPVSPLEEPKSTPVYVSR
jgi:uncharacterized membrane protein